MPLALNRIAQKKDVQGLVDQQHVFHGVLPLLAAGIELLIILVLGARDASLCAIMAKKERLLFQCALPGAFSILLVILLAGMLDCLF